MIYELKFIKLREGSYLTHEQATLFVWLLTSFTHLPVVYAGLIALAAIFLPEIKEWLLSIVPLGKVETQSIDSKMAADMLSLFATMWIPGNRMEFRTSY